MKFSKICLSQAPFCSSTLTLPSPCHNRKKPFFMRAGDSFPPWFTTLMFEELRCTEMSLFILHLPPILTLCSCGSTVCLNDSHLTSLFSTSLFNPHPKTAADWKSSCLDLFKRTVKQKNQRSQLFF